MRITGDGASKHNRWSHYPHSFLTHTSTQKIMHAWKWEGWHANRCSNVRCQMEVWKSNEKWNATAALHTSAPLNCSALYLHKQRNVFRNRANIMQLGRFVTCNSRNVPASSNFAISFKPFIVNNLIFWFASIKLKNQAILSF